MWVHFWFEESPRSEAPLASELVVEFSELPRSREISAYGGDFLITLPIFNVLFGNKIIL